MSSGISANQDCLAAFQELKLGKKLKYVIYGVSSDNKEIVVLKRAERAPELTYDDFLADLPENDCRWAVYDFEFEKEDGGKRSKICFYSWSPDESKIKSKMVYAASKDALRRSLVGVANEIQGTSFDEISYDTVLDKVSRVA